MDKLYHKPDDLQDMLSDYRWKVQSRHIDTNGHATNVNMLEEAWPSRAWAMVCARQRVQEGYRVDVFKIIAVSGAPRDDDDDGSESETGS